MGCKNVETTQEQRGQHQPLIIWAFLMHTYWYGGDAYRLRNAALLARRLRGFQKPDWFLGPAWVGCGTVLTFGDPSLHVGRASALKEKAIFLNLFDNC